VLTWSLDATAGLADRRSTTLVLRDDDRARADAVLRGEAPGRTVDLVRGGETRHESELQALRALGPQIGAGEVDVVLLHDAARPLASPELFGRVADAARRWGGALPVLEQPGLLFDEPPEHRPRLVTVQTPQGFAAGPLLAAYERAELASFAGSDTSACVERFSDLQVRAVPGEAANIKVTFADDLLLAQRLLARH
jgi:2-C-methyl-D-erythritol 4-phosphate cytidylyltransferase